MGIDHNAALVLHGDGTYRVLAFEDRPGSVGGSPGVVLKRAAPGGSGIEDSPAPAAGRVTDLLVPAAGDGVAEDPRLAAARAANPCGDISNSN